MSPPTRKITAKPKNAAAESGTALRGERPGVGKLIDVDVEKHLKWLETGEGKPWPPASRS